jgi:hypothetical protein
MLKQFACAGRACQQLWLEPIGFTVLVFGALGFARDRGEGSFT